jgi:hypothetical protein
MINFGTSAWIANAQSGSYARTFDLTNLATYSNVLNFNNTEAPATAAYLEDYLINAITAPVLGNAYLNIHSNAPGVPSGEIWGRTLARAMVSAKAYGFDKLT